MNLPRGFRRWIGPWYRGKTKEKIWFRDFEDVDGCHGIKVGPTYK